MIAEMPALSSTIATTAYTCLCVCLLSILTVRLSAAEPVFRDMNISLEIQPADFDYIHTASDGVTLSGSDTFNSLTGISAGWRHSFTKPGSRHGAVLGLHVTSLIGDYNLNSTYQSIGIRVTPGWAYALNDRFTLLTAPYIEYGQGSWEFPDNTVFDGFTASGDYLAWGANVHALYALNDHWQIDLAAGFRSREQNLSGDGQTIDIDNSGALALIGISYRFSASPTRLE